MRGYYVMGRLRPNATREQAQTELDAAMRELARRIRKPTATMRGDVMPFWRASRGPQGMLLQGLAILQA